MLPQIITGLLSYLMDAINCLQFYLNTANTQVLNGRNFLSLNTFMLINILKIRCPVASLIFIRLFINRAV